MASKRRSILVSILAVAAIVYSSLIFTARHLPFPVGLAMGRLHEGEALTDIGLTRLALGASVMRLKQGDHLQLAYDADAPRGALYIELASLRADGPIYKSIHYLPGRGVGRLVFTIPYDGIYHLSIGASRQKTPDGPVDPAYVVSYEVSWMVR